MDDDLKAWASSGKINDERSTQVIHKDSNGATIEAGDTVVFIKDLNVKGSGMVANEERKYAAFRLCTTMPNKLRIRLMGNR